MTAAPQVFGLPGGEPILHYGASEGPQLLVLQPLFEEMNRCRALTARLCRYFAARGFGCWLPDFPGCGDSLRALEVVGWSDWTDTVSDALAIIARETGTPALGTVSIRGGALLDGPSPHRWRLSPVTGASLLTDLRRSGLLSSGAYSLGNALAQSLALAEPKGDARSVRLEGDERPCNLRIIGPALWRRPEPLDDPDLAALIADDVDAWTYAIWSDSE